MAFVGDGDVAPQVTAAQHRAEARHGGRLDTAKPIHDVAQAMALDGSVLEIV